MKVMQIDVNYQYSSTGKIVADLHHELLMHGYESYACYGRGKKVNEPNVYKFGLDIETHIHALLTRITGLTGIFSFFSTQRLIKKIKTFKPHVIHIHELHAYFVNHARLMKYIKKHHIPVVWTFHCEYMYTGKCGHANDCKKFMTECHHCPQKKEYPKSIIFDFTRHMFRVKKALFDGFEPLTIVTPSDWLRKRVELSFLKDVPTKVIHNGIDTENTYLPKDASHIKSLHHIKDSTLVFVSIAPDIMSVQKGGKLVLSLAKRLIDEDVIFIMIGSEDVSIEVPSNVILLGKIYDKKLLTDYYNVADTFILFSQKENFPTTALESLSCGTPLLAFDTGGTKETAKHGYATFIEYANLNQAEKLIRSKEIKKKTKEEQLRCANTYRELYSKKTMYAHYEDVYGHYAKGTHSKK